MRRRCEYTFADLLSGNVKEYVPPGQSKLLISRYSLRRALFDVFMDILVALSILSSLFFLGFRELDNGSSLWFFD